MFFEVRIYKPDGTMKNIVSSSELCEKYWKKFEKIERDIGLKSSVANRVPGWVKTKLDLEYLSNFDFNH